MRLGIVDLGTLSLRFDVAETAPGKRPHLVARYRSMPRLGDYLTHPGTAGSDPETSLIAEFRRVRRFADEHQVSRIIAVGTAVLRELPQSSELLRKIDLETGIQVRVISGDEEARLTAIGILANEPGLPEKVALVDIGGGSTEITFTSGRTIEDTISINAGALRLTNEFLRGKQEPGRPPGKDIVAALTKKVEEELQALQPLAAKYHCDQLIGSSGTARTLENLGVCDTLNGRAVISRARIDELFHTLCELNEEETLRLPGMEPVRAEVILAGCAVLLRVMDILKVSTLCITHFSLRHGVLEEALRQNEG
ncbi:MAG: hypothetical protein U0136_07320 [Bdellovibrionota bacterium]